MSVIFKSEEIASILYKEKFIVFAGAGIPTETGLPLWRTLLKELNNEAKVCNQDLDEVDSGMFPHIAQQIYDDFKKKGNVKRYFEIIKEKLIPINAPYSVAQLEIITTTNCVITTNFDDTFESAFSKKYELQRRKNSLEIHSLPDLLIKELNEKEYLYYLHGRVNENYIIFRTDDYENYYPSENNKSKYSKDIYDFLKYIYQNYCVVFIGFSFNDVYFINMREEIYNDIKISDSIANTKPGYIPKLNSIHHYIFLKKNKNDDDTFIQKKLKKLNDLKIEVFFYLNHIDWINVFSLIRKLREQNNKESQ